MAYALPRRGGAGGRKAGHHAGRGAAGHEADGMRWRCAYVRHWKADVKGWGWERELAAPGPRTDGTPPGRVQTLFGIGLVRLPRFTIRPTWTATGFRIDAFGPGVGPAGLGVGAIRLCAGAIGPGIGAMGSHAGSTGLGVAATGRCAGEIVLELPARRRCAVALRHDVGASGRAVAPIGLFISAIGLEVAEMGLSVRATVLGVPATGREVVARTLTVAAMGPGIPAIRLAGPAIGLQGPRTGRSRPAMVREAAPIALVVAPAPREGPTPPQPLTASTGAMPRLAPSGGRPGPRTTPLHPARQLPFGIGRGSVPGARAAPILLRRIKSDENLRAEIFVTIRHSVKSTRPWSAAPIVQCFLPTSLARATSHTTSRPALFHTSEV